RQGLPVLLLRREDRGQAVRNPLDAFQVRIAQAAVVVDVDRAIAVELLYQQADRRLAVLRGLDRVLEHALVVGLVVHRDDGGAGAQAGVERRAVPAHVADAAVLAQRQAERVHEVATAAAIRLGQRARLVLVDQLPAGGLDAPGQWHLAVEALAQEGRPVVRHYSAERRDHVLERVGVLHLPFAVVDAEEGPGEIVQRLAVLRAVADQRVGFQPDQLAGAVIVLAHLVVAVRTGGARGD